MVIFPALSFTLPPLFSPFAPAVVVFVLVLYVCEKSAVSHPLPPVSEHFAVIVLLVFVHAAFPPLTLQVGAILSTFTVYSLLYREQFPALSQALYFIVDTPSAFMFRV